MLPGNAKPKVICSYCQKETSLKKGTQIPDTIGGFIAEKSYWICISCNAWVGCHKDTIRPYGTLANERLRQLRRETHQLFDNLWKYGILSRSDAYSWLAGELCIPLNECHIGCFNKEICTQAITILKKKKIYPPDSF